MSTRISKYSYHLINNLSNKSETFVSKKSLLKMAPLNKNNQILFASKYIYNEIPIRFSKRIRELEHLPLYLNKDHEIFQIRDWYLESLDEVTNLKEPNNIDECYNVKKVMEEIYNRHSRTLIIMSNGIHKLKKKNLIDENVDSFLTNFYYKRTRTRFLIGNYLDYFKEKDNRIGAIDTDCNIQTIVNKSLNEIEIISDIHRINIPEIKVDVPVTNFSYPKTYLYYILIEILKNSIVALQNIKNPLIQISTHIDNNYIIIKISDNGIGIDDKNFDDIWKFSYTTSKINNNNTDIIDFESQSPISGLGYGLPLSKIFIKTFNGNIKVFSKKNIGTETYLFIDITSNWKL